MKFIVGHKWDKGAVNIGRPTPLGRTLPGPNAGAMNAAVKGTNDSLHSMLYSLMAEPLKSTINVITISI